jgi:hypothetical protein
MDIQAWIAQQRPNILEGLKTFLRYPTISAQTAYYPAPARMRQLAPGVSP